MAKKTNAIGMRIGVNQTWRSQWYANKKQNRSRLEEDLKARKYLSEKLSSAGLDELVIRRTMNATEIEVFVARPGVVIGRGGAGIEEIKKELSRMLGADVDFKV